MTEVQMMIVLTLYYVVPIIVAGAGWWWFFIQNEEPENGYRDIYWYWPARILMGMYGFQSRLIPLAYCGSDCYKSTKSYYEYKFFLYPKWPSDEWNEYTGRGKRSEQNVKAGCFYLFAPFFLTFIWITLDSIGLTIEMMTLPSLGIAAFIAMTFGLRHATMSFKAAIARHAADPKAHQSNTRTREEHREL